MAFGHAPGGVGAMGSDKPYRLEYDIRHCEGNFNCISADATHFLALPGGERSDIPEGRMQRGLKMLDIPESELDEAREAVSQCPPKVIRIRDLRTGRVIAGPEAFVDETTAPAR